MQVLFYLHSWLRWVIVLVALIAIVKDVIGLIRRQSFDKMANGLMRGFSGLLDLQALVGLIYLVVSGLAGVGFPMDRFEHAGAMILAVVAGHLPARLKASSNAQKYRNALFCLILALVLIAAGVAALGDGASHWQLRF